MKKIVYFLMLGAFALVLSGCPDLDLDIDDEDINTITNGQEDSGDTGDDTGDSGETGDSGDTGDTPSGITGNTVTAVSNCVFFIEGESFTASGDYSTDVYSTKRVPVTLASGSDNQVAPVGEAIVFVRPLSGETKSLYYLLKARNNSQEDFNYVYARGLKFFNNDSTYTKSLDGTLKGHLRETDTNNQTSHNTGLRPNDEGYFFSLTAGQIDIANFEAIDRAELTTSLMVNAGSPSHTDVEAEIKVLGYRYGDRAGNMGLEISIQNIGDTAVQLNKNPRVFLMNGDDVTLFHGSFTRFPTGGLVQPGETGGYFQSATDLGNASANKIMIILDYQDPPR